MRAIHSLEHRRAGRSGQPRRKYHQDLLGLELTRGAAAYAPRRACIAAGCLLALGGSVSGAREPAAGHQVTDARLAAAAAAIESTIGTSGTEVAVAFRTLDGSSEWLRHADESFHAASTMKLAVLIEAYRQVGEGRLRLDSPITIRNEFHSLADGSPYALDPQDDSERELYRHMGETRAVSELCELMITVSSNLATNLLMDRLGVDHIREGVHALGADGMNVRRGLEDGKAFAKGINNTTTAAALLRLLQAVADGQAVSADASAAMRATLERQTINDRIPAGLPAGIRIAHKTGDISGICHDAAIVYARRPFVLVVLTRGAHSLEEGAQLIAAIARILYDASQ